MEIRTRILHKAHELFNKFGIRSVTMDEIASQLGMSKKTIYQSFANKDEIIDAVIEEHINRNTQQCIMDGNNADNAIHQIFLSIEMVQQMLQNVNPAIFNDLEKFYPAIFLKLNHFKDDFLYKIISDNIKWGITEGLYRADMDIDIITKLRLNTMFMPFNQDIFPYHNYTLVTVQIEMLEHFLYGLATTKAHTIIAHYKNERIKTKIND